MLSRALVCPSRSSLSHSNHSLTEGHRSSTPCTVPLKPFLKPLETSQCQQHLTWPSRLCLHLTDTYVYVLIFSLSPSPLSYTHTMLLASTTLALCQFFTPTTSACLYCQVFAHALPTAGKAPPPTHPSDTSKHLLFRPALPASSYPSPFHPLGLKPS